MRSFSLVDQAVCTSATCLGSARRAAGPSPPRDDRGIQSSLNRRNQRSGLLTSVTVSLVSRVWIVVATWAGPLLALRRTRSRKLPWRHHQTEREAELTMPSRLATHLVSQARPDWPTPAGNRHEDAHQVVRYKQPGPSATEPLLAESKAGRRAQNRRHQATAIAVPLRRPPPHCGTGHRQRCHRPPGDAEIPAGSGAVRAWTSLPKSPNPESQPSQPPKPRRPIRPPSNRVEQPLQNQLSPAPQDAEGVGPAAG